MATPVAFRLSSFVVLTALVTAACGGQAADQTTTPSTAAVSASRIPGADAAGIVWLCLPGKDNNPCEAKLTTTVIDTSGKNSVETVTPAADPPIDCFYVYPTTSRQKTVNADLSIDPELVTIATWQAAPFSQVCKVYAPIYPQLTIAALNGGMASADATMTAYAGVYKAFDDYLTSYNHGRGVVLMGHSQGAMLLISLLEDRVDTAPEVRKLLVSALLLGGNATTAPGQTTGGDFAEIPTCASAQQTGCVVGYSSFGETPPADAMFGRAATAIGMLRPPAPGEQMMCTNPAALGGKGTLLPLIAAVDLPNVATNVPTPLPSTTFVSYQNAYSAECKTSDTDAWLQITPLGPPGTAPTLTGTEGPTWGLHDFDVAAPLGNLIELVRAESAAYAR